MACVALALSASACGACSSEREPESDLGGLLHADKAPAAIDVSRASQDFAELARAVTQPHHVVTEALGAHAVRMTASSQVSSGGKLVDGLKTESRLLIDQHGHFRAEADNDKDYGRHAIYDGEWLYLRPRFGKYHKRRAETPEEPGQLFDAMTETPAAHFELVGPGAAIRKSREDTVGGRPALVVVLEHLADNRERPQEKIAQREWRASAKTTACEGTIALDKETGVLLAATLTGTLAYTRDGQNFTMKLDLDYEIADVGTASEVSPPPEEETVSAPRTSKELEEREALLRSIAPPARRGPVPSPAADRAK